jgi:hypothetical protein
VQWDVTGSGVNPANAADFVGGVLPAGTLNFAPGETSKAVAVNIAGDSTTETDERFQISLSAPSPGVVLAVTTTATAVILNDDYGGLIAYSRLGESGFAVPEAYIGPVLYLQQQWLGTAQGEVAVGTVGNDFLNLLGGDDAADGAAGDDVLDGGTGSNFLTGGTGWDVFFLDGRGGQTTWATITDWQAGEQLSVWGWRPGVSEATWVASAGAIGYEGITMHADLNGDGAIETSVTWTGMVGTNLPAPIEFDGLLWFR